LIDELIEAIHSDIRIAGEKLDLDENKKYPLIQQFFSSKI
jgi:hypothetical protein